MKNKCKTEVVTTVAQLQRFLSTLPPETKIYTYDEPNIYDISEQVNGLGCIYDLDEEDYSENPSYVLYMSCPGEY